METGRRHCWLSVGGQLFFLLSCIAIFSFSFKGSGEAADVLINHVPALQVGYVSDWHSSLFLREVALLRQVTAGLTGVTLTPLQTLDVAVYAALVCMLLCLLLWQDALMRHDGRYIVLSPLLAGSFAIFMIFFDRHFVGALDYYFLCVFLVSITSLLFLRSKKRGVKLVAAFILLLSLLHVVSFRRNALILVPFLCFGGLRLLLPYVGWGKIMSAGLSIAAAVVFSASWIGGKLAQQQTHSASVMLVSELRMAALLCGKEQQEAHWLSVHTPLGWPPRTAKLLRADAENDSPDPQRFDPMGRVPLQEEEWQSLVTRYVQMWRHHPLSLATARLILATQFYAGSETAMPIRKLTEMLFPSVRLHPEYWNLPIPGGEPPHLGKQGWLWPCGVLLFLAYLRHGLRNHRLGEERWRFLSFVMGLAFLYELSFLILTPAPFYRYHSPFFLLVLFFIPLACVDMLLWVQKRKVERRIFCLY